MRQNAPSRPRLYQQRCLRRLTPASSDRGSVLQPDRVYAADWRNLGHSCSRGGGTSSAPTGIAMRLWCFLYAACNPAGMNSDATAHRITNVPLISPIGRPWVSRIAAYSTITCQANTCSECWPRKVRNRRVKSQRIAAATRRMNALRAQGPACASHVSTYRSTKNEIKWITDTLRR